MNIQTPRSGSRLSVVTQFDGPLIAFDDGLRAIAERDRRCVPANSDVAISISDVHQNHEQERRQR